MNAAKDKDEVQAVCKKTPKKTEGRSFKTASFILKHNADSSFAYQLYQLAASAPSTDEDSVVHFKKFVGGL